MKDFLLDDDYIIEYICDNYGKDHWSKIKKVDQNGHDGHADLCLNFYRAKATAYEVVEDLDKIEEKYHKLIAKRFYKKDMTYDEKEHILVKAVFKIFFHDYIQEYPKNNSIFAGMDIALSQYRYLLEYKDNGEYVDLFIPYLKMVHEYFGKKFIY